MTQPGDRRKLLPLEALSAIDTLSGQLAARQDSNDDQQAKNNTDTTALTTLVQQSVGMGRVAVEADLTGKPAGLYEIIGTNERVTWSGSAVTVRGPLLATAANLDKRAAITPQMFGAKADGVTDDTAALKAWRDYVVANPNKHYHWDGQYVLSEPLVFQFQAGVAGYCTIHCSALILSKIPTYDDVLQFRNCWRLALPGSLTVSGNGGAEYASRKNRHGIRVYNAFNFSAGRLTAQFLLGNGVWIDDATTMSNIQAIHGSYCGSNGSTNAAVCLTRTLTDLGAGTIVGGAAPEQRQTVTLNSALPAEVTTNTWFVRIGTWLHRITEIDAARTGLTLYPSLKPGTAVGDSAYFIGGAAYYSQGGDASATTVGTVDAMVCGFGWQPNALYPGNVSSLITQECGVALLFGFSISEAAVTVNVGYMYTESDQFQVVKATTAQCQTYIGPNVGLVPSKIFNMAPAFAPSSTGFNTSFTRFDSLTIVQDHGLAQTINQGPNGQDGTGIDLKVETGRTYYVSTAGNYNVSLPNIVDLNRVTGIKGVTVVIQGTGANKAPTGTITVIPPAGHKINTLAAGANMTLSGFKGQVTLRCQYVGMSAGVGIWWVSADYQNVAPQTAPADTAVVAAGAAPTKAEYDALLTEFRALKTAVKNAGVLT